MAETKNGTYLIKFIYSMLNEQCEAVFYAYIEKGNMAKH